MLNEDVKKQLKTIIEDCKKYADNVWLCYETCKTTIRELQKTSEIKRGEYDHYIQYITDILKI